MILTNKKKRIITGAVIAVIMAGVVFAALLLHPLFYDVFIMLLALLASIEVADVVGAKFPHPMRTFIVIDVVLGYVAFMLAQQSLSIGGITTYFCILALVCIACIITSLILKQKRVDNVVATMFVLVYPVSFLIYAMGLNYLADPYRAMSILLLVLVCPFTDMFAYFVGSTLKGKKLCPKISPNKTISGSLGGLFGGLLASFIVYLLSLTAFGQLLGLDAIGSVSIVHYLILGFAVSVATQAGDLLASIVKRMTGVKDYGKLLPGHGGIMDRIDGMILGAVMLYVYMVFLTL